MLHTVFALTKYIYRERIIFMRDYLSLGSSPTEEPCVSVSSNGDYVIEMKKECSRFKKMLEEIFVDRPENCSFAAKAFPHDFGTYYEVVIYYDDSNENEGNFAFFVEENIPDFWENTDKIFFKKGEIL